MTRSNMLIRSVLGVKRGNISPFATAVDCLIRRSFCAGLSPEDISVSSICDETAEILSCSPGAATRQIQRIANACWDVGDREALNRIIGKELEVCPSPREMLIYFAAYSYYGVPYHEAIEAQLAKLF